MGYKNGKRRKIKRIRNFLLLISLVTSFSIVNVGCTRFVNDEDISLNEDFGFINNEKADMDKSKEVEEDKKEALESDDKELKKEEIKSNVENISSSNCLASAKVNGVSKYDVEKMLKGKYEGPLANEKIVFLTFDDGPSRNTIEILNVLKKYKVNGTFFVLGSAVKSNPEYLKQVFESGNAIGNHTYNHSYKKIYPNQVVSISDYMEEYNKTENEIRKVLGDEFSSNLIRMPGGEMSREFYNDPNLSSFKERLKEENIASVDWNALNGDAEGKNYSVNELVDYAKKSAEGKNHVVLLMHDTEQKYLTVRALPEIIEHFIKEGYSFKIMI